MASIMLFDPQLRDKEPGELQPSMRPVAIAAGYLDPLPNELVKAK